MKRTFTKILITILIAVLSYAGFNFYKHGRSIYMPIYYRIFGEKTLKQAVTELEPDVEKRLKPDFEKAGLNYLSGKLTFLTFKKEKKLEVWGEKNGKYSLVKTYPILAASGTEGPKLKEGDKQVPEGIYKITSMNPNSYYYLAMLVDYPNEFDRKEAQKEGRTRLGGDICIHGKDVSTGCLAVGDKAMEELFVSVAKVGMDNVKVIISPYDFRRESAIKSPRSAPDWVPELYESIRSEVNKFALF